MAYHEIRRLRVSQTEIPSGGTVRIECDVVNASGTLMTPDTTKRVNIRNPDGNAVASSPFAFTADSAGKLHYDYTTLASLRAGWYHLLVETTDAATTSVSQEDRLEYAFKTTG